MPSWEQRAAGVRELARLEEVGPTLGMWGALRGAGCGAPDIKALRFELPLINTRRLRMPMGLHEGPDAFLQAAAPGGALICL